MKIVKNKIIPPRGFSYVNLFGVLFTRRDKKISDKTWQEFMEIVKQRQKGGAK